MSYEIPGFTRSYEAAVDLSGSYLKFVKKSGALIVACAAATDNVIGVLQNKPNEPGVGVFTGTENAAGTVMISGVTRVKAGAAIAAGVAATIDAQGRVVAAGAGNPVVGVTETAAANADEVVSLLLKPLGAVAD
jgi:hypothetical protein